MKAFRRRKKINPKRILTIFALLVVVVILIRLILIMNMRTNLAIERRDNAANELEEIDTLATQLEAEALKLSSSDGLEVALRERYGLINENEGYLLLLDEYPDLDVNTATEKSWWKIF